jgi:hypothetical protein
VKLNEKTAYARSAEVTFNALLDRYIEEEMPIRHSTKGSYTSIFNIGACADFAYEQSKITQWFTSREN